MSPVEGFAPVLAYVRLLSGFRRPWMVAGGWAIDLFLGRVTREHEDVDIAIFRADQHGIRTYLQGWEFDRTVEGHRDPWPVGNWLEPPVHEVHGHRASGEPRTIEILLNESTGEDWVFRRDGRITRPRSRALCRTSDGVPFLAPEIVLLFKAKAPKRKDWEDFAQTWGRLGVRRRLWLRRALGTVHPEHPWIAQR